MNPQRYLAACGVGSRRACDRLISEGRVLLNGKPLAFGMDINEDDVVTVDGERVDLKQTHYIALNKPAGYISDRGVPKYPSALDLDGLPRGLFAVGRLDQDATGLLLLTNDGELAHRLMHPSFEHEKEYRVLVNGAPSEATLEQWRRGIDLDGELTAPAQVAILKTEPRGTWLKVILHEGRKRQIKRVAKQLGHPVIELARVRIGSIRLGDLKIGTWRALTAAEVREMIDAR